MKNLMKPVTKIGLVAIAIAALATLSAPTAKASCGSPETARRVLANRPAFVLQPTLTLSAADAVQDSETEQGPEPSIAGLWKTVFTSGGSVATVGFDSWHSDGTEFAYDSAPILTSTYCPGTWEKKGRRTYATVHPSYLYDPVKLQHLNLHHRRWRSVPAVSRSESNRKVRLCGEREYECRRPILCW